MHGERRGFTGVRKSEAGVHLQLFKAGRLAVKQSSIINYALNGHKIPGVSPISPNKSSFLLCYLW